VIVAYIDAHKGRFGVEPICRMLTEHGIPIAPSTYYAHRCRRVSGPEWADDHLANKVVDLWLENRSVYGIDKLAAAARRAGLDVGCDQVARLMGILGISGAVRGSHRRVTTRQDPGAPRHPDRCKRAWDTPSRPERWWVADFTYVWTSTGFVYVSFVTDVFSRRILGWQVSKTKKTPLVMAALQQALFTRRRHNAKFTSAGLVFHSDAGSQYTSIMFTEALREEGIAPSIGTVGDALDNALMESTIGLYKTELIDFDDRSWRDAQEVETATAEYVHWFNNDRLHSSIGMLPPVECEALNLVCTAFPAAEVA
jgi:putative transposase